MKDNLEIKLYRKRFVPDELTHLKDDIILEFNEKIMITKWKTIRPRNDFSHGLSCYYINEGYKVSLFYNHQNELVYTYCDIVNLEYSKEENTVTYYDLLIDVVIYPNGFVKVLDVAELAECIESKQLNEEMVKKALTTTDNLLQIIYNDKLDTLTAPFAPYID